MTKETYLDLKSRVIEAGYQEEIDWAANISEPKTADEFFCEYTYVVCNSGMKQQIARVIFEKIMRVINAGLSASSAFNHKGKSLAIDKVYTNRRTLFRKYRNTPDSMKLAFLRDLPWIGDITKYHLAKNFGHDCIKPDRHLVRIAANCNTTPEMMCRLLSEQTGDRLSVVDTVIWRAANLGWV